MGTHPDQPLSQDRRRLLLALGGGAVNLAALRRIDVAPRRGRMATDGYPSAPTAAPSMPSPLASPATAPTGPSSPPALAGAPPPPGADHVFDVVVTGGRLLDPDSGFDGIVNLGADGGTITAISPANMTGRQAIDATGLVVAPGFVDLLSYEPNSFGAWLKLADGVTTNLAMHGVNNYADAFFRRYEDRTPVHYGGAFHHHFMRGFDIGAGVEDQLTEPQLAELESLTRSSLDQGFAGISFSPEYSPGTTTAEMERLAAVAAEYGHVCFFHVRHSDPDPPGTSLEAIEEVLAIASRTGIPVHIEHLSSTGGTFVMDRALAMIEGARDGGADVSACLYPYDFWGTFLGSSRFSLGWRKRYRLSESDLQVAGTATRLSPETFDAAVRDNKLVAALGSIPEEEIRLALTRSWVMVASDSIPGADLNNHPRGAGTFARTIGRYVREFGVLDLMTGLAKITILPARRVEGMIPTMARKGRLQRGADADIVIFDPLTIGDRATVEMPAAPSVGIRWVLVGGRIAMADAVIDRSVMAGRPLRSGT